jgi:hypothetical protein
MATVDELDLIADPAKRATQAAAMLVRIREAQRRAEAARDSAVRELVARGLPQKDAARIAQVTKQRVSQIVASGAAPPAGP